MICWECNWNHIFPAHFINLNIFKSVWISISELEIAGRALPAAIETHCHLVAQHRYYASPEGKKGLGLVAEWTRAGRGQKEFLKLCSSGSCVWQRSVCMLQSSGGSRDRPLTEVRTGRGRAGVQGLVFLETRVKCRESNKTSQNAIS